MPKRIPIADAKRIVKKHKLRQLVLVAWDGETTHVVTYGKTLLDSNQAALGGNNVKKWLGWPESLQKARPARVTVACTRGLGTLINLIGGPEVFLRAMKWRKAEEIPAHHANNKGMWVPPYNHNICFSQKNAIAVCTSGWFWGDMAKGRW